MNQTDPTAARHHHYLTGLSQQARYVHEFAKAGRTAEALEHAAAIERLLAAWREAMSAVVSPPTDRAADEVDADTVANRAAQVITSMGADIRALKHQRDRYRTAWRSARERAQAYGEGILRIVKDRESYQQWLRQAEEHNALLRRLAVEAHDTGTQQQEDRAAIERAFAGRLAAELKGCCSECDACIEIAQHLAGTEQAAVNAPKRPPMDPVHILGIEAAEPAPVAQQPAAADGEETPTTWTPGPVAVGRAAKWPGRQTTALLATPCDACEHTLNWHRNDVGCTVRDCVCGRFREPERP